MAATVLISVDMGGYQMADAMAASRETWIIASFNGFLLGPHIVFTIPVALAMLPKRDHRYLALGMMPGLIAIPIALLVSLATIVLSDPMIRPTVATGIVESYRLAMSWEQVLRNLLPLVLIVMLIVLGLLYVPNLMVRIFMIFGRFVDAAIKLVFGMCVIEYFTGGFSRVFGNWPFDPLMADSANSIRGLEIAGYIGIMLAGAFPMVYALRTYCAKPIERLGRATGFSALGSSGLIATTANPLVLFRLIPEMDARNKVMTIAYAVCGSWMLGDSLAFIANFQPSLIVPLMFGKLVGAICAILIARKLSVSRALQFEEEDRRDGVASPPAPAAPSGHALEGALL
jgi:ethanolamine transporter